MTLSLGDHIFKAPCCGAKFALLGYSSITRNIVERWSDGFVYDTLAPQDRGLCRCRACGDYFLLRKAEKVGYLRHMRTPRPVDWESQVYDPERWVGDQEDWENRYSKYYDCRPWSEIEAERAQRPIETHVITEEELDAVLATPRMLDAEIETIARRRLWQYLNAPYRKIYRSFKQESLNTSPAPEYIPTESQLANIKRLIVLLNAQAEPPWLEVAELYREAGQSADARVALAKVTNPEQLGMVQLMNDLITQGVAAPVRYRY